jgi:plasmid stability protein
MATLTINNISDDLLEKLERSARENGRTVEEEAMQWILSAEGRLRGFRELRNRFPDVRITDEQITRAKREGIHSDTTGESSEKPDPWIERARRHRESMPGVFISDDEELSRFKREGRL